MTKVGTVEIDVQLKKCSFCELNEKHIEVLKLQVEHLQDQLKQLAYREMDNELTG